MTTATLLGKRTLMTIEDKARLLRTFEIGEEGRLAVTSGSNPHNAYVCHHDGRTITHCPCKASGNCAHKVAGNWYLAAKRLATKVHSCIHCGRPMAQDGVCPRCA